MRIIDEQYLRTPTFGSRMMAHWLRRHLSTPVNRKRVQRLMRVMGIEAIYPKPRTTCRNTKHRVFPYLLRMLCGVYMHSLIGSSFSSWETVIIAPGSLCK